MQTTDTSTQNNKNKRIILIIVAVALVLLCCIVIVIVGAVLLLRPSRLSISSRDVTPPYYGVFINQGGSLVEIQETEIFDLPTEDQVMDVLTVTDSKPEIIVWRTETNLDYLVLYKLGQFLHEQEEMQYTATPKNDGVIQITQSSTLSNGAYCLVQGDPLGMFLPGWCFRVETSR